MDDLDSLALQFIAETRDNLDDAARCLLELEQNSEPDLINRIFRNFHTIKGTSSIFPEFEAITSLTHVAEDLMVQVRKGNVLLTCDHVDLFLSTLDLVGVWIDSYEAAGVIQPDAFQTSAPLREKFIVILKREEDTPSPGALAPAAAAEPAVSTVPELLQAPLASLLEEPHKKTALPSFLKIDQTLINRYTECIDEMIVANQALSSVSLRASGDYQIPPLSKEIDGVIEVTSRIIENLQGIATEMRMLPVSTAFERSPRLVRDISAKLGKKVKLVMEGEDTMADRDVIEALAGPLVHLVRNSLDHGLEAPQERIAAGKPPEGIIRLTARHENAAIVVEVQDDGRGIDPEKIRAKAAEKGFVSPEKLAVMSADELIQLVLMPNFSTAENISDLSGRGVGLDAVNSTVSNFGGSVKIFASKGSGCRISMTLPLGVHSPHAVIALW